MGYKSHYLRFLDFGLDNQKNKCHNKYHKAITQLTKEKEKMAVNNATYKVGDLYTSQKSKVTGTITEIKPNTDGSSVRVKLDVNGTPRWTTWTAK